jgi:hypothetical protein
MTTMIDPSTARLLCMSHIELLLQGPNANN